MEKTSDKRKLKIYIVGDNTSYLSLFSGLHKMFGIECERVLIADKADIALFTGGEDVSPSFYTQKGLLPHATVYANPSRDKSEAMHFHYFKYKNTPMIGVCRGAQFLTVMNGGTLIQDVNNHGMPHMIRLYNGKEINIISTHHQMMYPYDLQKEDYELLAWTEKPLSTVYHFSGNFTRHSIKSDGNEPEIVYYKKSKSLAIQGHPERQTSDKDVTREISIIIAKYGLPHRYKRIIEENLIV